MLLDGSLCRSLQKKYSNQWNRATQCNIATLRSQQIWLEAIARKAARLFTTGCNP